MGYVFESDDDEIWSPGNLVGQVLMRQVEDLERLVGQKSGVTEYMSGLVKVDFAQLGDFLAATASYLGNIHNHTLHLLLRPAVVTLVALYDAEQNHDRSRKFEFEPIVFSETNGILRRW